METIIIDGKSLAQQHQLRLKNQIEQMETKPTLAVILVGDNPASHIYVNNKQRLAQQVGIISELFQLSPVMTQDALIAFIQELNQNDKVDGILVQLPLPAHINTDEVLESISPEKDVDGLTIGNLGHLFAGKSRIVPCTPLACMDLIKSVCVDLTGKHAVIVGRSKLVGKPLAQLLLNENCTVTQAHSKTVNLRQICRQADILIAAAGKPKLIKKSFVKQGAIVIDVGINRLKTNKIVGDVDFDALRHHAGAITPVPGGVGPMTVTMLMENTTKIHMARHTKK